MSSSRVLVVRRWRGFVSRRSFVYEFCEFEGDRERQIAEFWLWWLIGVYLIEFDTEDLVADDWIQIS